MKLSSRVQFADEKLKNAFDGLRLGTSEEIKLYEFLVRAFTDIEKDAFCGIQIPKNLIPREYAKKYGVKNLWKYNLPDAWRLIYSIEAGQIIVVSIILEWMSHKDYEKRFGYK
jgi:mRNA-degrading endonuclease RelE of RelBE toxin-antitoxin system